jgi:hypothetical protein
VIARQLQPTRAPRASLLHYAPAMVLLLIVVADSAQFPDPDLWGHLRFGQAALASGHVIARDTYSYSAAGAVWRNHEWLTEIIMAAAYNTLGVVGLKLWKFACVAATMVLMALGLAETGASPTIQMNTLGLAALAMVPQNQFRPQLFTFMLLAATLALLARDNYRGRAPLWLAIPILMLWGNLHGGFIIGIATLATYTGVIGLQDLLAKRGLARALRLGLITLAATLATPGLTLRHRRLVGCAERAEALCGPTDYRRLATAAARHRAGVAHASCEHGLLHLRSAGDVGVRGHFHSCAARQRSAARGDCRNLERGGLHRGAQHAARDDRVRRAARAPH